MSEKESEHLNIPLKRETKEELVKRKLHAQALKGVLITWDDFLLEATE